MAGMDEAQRQLLAAFKSLKEEKAVLEIYLAQAEQRIAELEAELAKAKEESQSIGEKWGIDFADVEKFYTEMPRQQGKTEQYKRKSEVDKEAYDKQQAYQSLQRWLAANPKGIEGQAEKYLNEFLGQPPVGDGSGPQKDYVGGRYKITAYGDRPGQTTFRVQGPKKDMEFAWNFTDGVSFDEFQKQTTHFLPDLMESLGIEQRPEVAKKLLDDFTVCMANIRNGSVTHTIERGGR